MADFQSLIQSAVQLNAEIDENNEWPRVQRNLGQLVEAGQKLLMKTHREGGTDVKAAILLGSRGVDLPSISQKLESLNGAKSATHDVHYPLVITDIAGFLRSERENAILSIVEETRRETFAAVDRSHWDAVSVEWEKDKRKILASLSDSVAGSDLVEVTQNLRPESSHFHESTLGTRSVLDQTEIMYSKEIMDYNGVVKNGGLKPVLVDKLISLFPESKNQEVFVMWQMVHQMSKLSSLIGSDPIKSRISAQFCREVAVQGRQYLETSFKKYIKATVFDNLQHAQLGGVPGTLHLIRSFLKIKNQPLYQMQGLEDGVVWPLIFFCLRCGDVSAAVQAALEGGVALADVAKLLIELRDSSDQKLSPSSESAVQLTYRRSIRRTIDPYKRAVYCLLGACEPTDEHPDLATSLDDYLWLKLIQLREESFSASTAMSLAQLQNLLSEEYGESYFDAFKQPLVYFQVLFLTGQFETAVEFLFRVDRLRAHGVHIALVLYEDGLLAIPTSISAPLLSRESTERSSCNRRLNLARLLMLYVKRFESTDPKEALHYLYFMREMKGTNSNESLFASSVSELVLESREYDLLLGTLHDDGFRTPGLIDSLHGNVVDTQKIIELIAKDSEQKGIYEDSVHLYDLARNHEKVVELLNKLLSQLISQTCSPESQRDRVQRSAVKISKRYRTMGHTASGPRIAAFYLLLDLAHFFDLYHTKKSDDAIESLLKLNIVPLDASSTEPLVANFRVLPEEIRRNIPEILLATMSILFGKYQNTKQQPITGGFVDGGRTQQLEKLRQMAKTIITFAGMIPYRMPGDSNARLVQMEVLMN